MHNECTCGKVIGKHSKQCRSCAAKAQPQCKPMRAWPPMEEIEKLLKVATFDQVAKALSVNRNTLRSKVARFRESKKK